MKTSGPVNTVSMLDRPHALSSVHYASLAKLESSYWWHQSRLNWAKKIIRTHIREHSHLNVLDYGCGTGGFLHQLNSDMAFNSCLGVDVADEAIKRAQTYPENFKKIEPFDFSVIPGRDLIFLMDTLEHIEHDADFLKKIISNMDNEAHLLISVPAFSCLYSSWDDTLGHHRRYERKGITQLADDAGGCIIFNEYTFSYLYPVIVFKRIVAQAKYVDDNCEFPPVPYLLNGLLLGLNRLEMWGSKYLRPPLGSSLFCLIQK